MNKTHTVDTNQPDGLVISSLHDTWNIEKGVTVSDDADYALLEGYYASGNTINIDGSVTDKGWAVGINGLGTHLTLGADGAIDAGYGGISFTGAYAQFTNEGGVWGGSVGVHFEGGHFKAVNNASITAGDWAWGVDHAGGGRIVNGADGLISAHASGIFVENKASQDTKIINHGEIHGDNFSIYSTSGQEHIRNTGLLDGNVSLGGGDDVLDSRGGGIAGSIDLGGGDDRLDLRHRSLVPVDPSASPVYGGGGNDTFIIDGAVDIIEAKNGGFDVVRSSASVTLADNVEELLLLGKKDIDGTGSAGGDRLEGNAGDNHLRGMGGADEISGNKGNDILTGGGDADTFFFVAGSGHDKVTDFVAGIDHVDLEDFDIPSFHALKTHHMENVGDDLAISIGDDTLTLKHTHIADIDKNDFVL